jgi:DNA invertase Pin-like site-specific DNA recombinase
MRTGDVLVVWKLDRLGRSVKGLVDLVGKLAEEGVQFHSLTDGIDTTTPHGRFFFHMMASLAQMEREFIAERTKTGLDAARKRGRMVGRKRRMTPSKIESARWRDGTTGSSEKSRGIDPDTLSMGPGFKPLRPLESAGNEKGTVDAGA